MRLLVFGQERGERSLQRVRVAANCVRRIAVVRALAVKAQVLRWRYEKRFQQIVVGHHVDVGGDVQHSTRHGHRTSKAEQPDGVPVAGTYLYVGVCTPNTLGGGECSGLQK